jgi:hypothetical protein
MTDGRQFTPLMIAEPNRDAFEQMAERIESDVDKEGWDQPNRLFRINTHASPLAGMSALMVAEVPWPEAVARSHPIQALKMDLNAVLALPAKDLGLDQFVGLALATEGWMLSARVDDEAAVAEVNAISGRREVHKHPDRIEVRTVMLIAPGTQVQVLRQRGHAPDLVDVAADAGAVPDALRALFAAFVVRRLRVMAGLS